LFDLQGRAVKTLKTENTTNEIDVTDVKPGMYILDVEAKGLHKGFKVMVKH
jgi:phosphoribosylaminoimidazole (AIR) synthetase